MTEPRLDPPSPATLRAELETAVLRDLQGPAGGPEEEVNEQRVRDRYVVGMLAPRRQRIGNEMADDLALGGAGSVEDGTPDLATPRPGALVPSSLGLSFTVAGDTRALQVTARWGRYERRDSAVLTTEATDGPKKVWKRRPIEARSAIPLGDGPVAAWVPDPDQPEVTVQGLARRSHEDWIVTLFLVNGQTEPERLRDEAWLFQAGLAVESPDGASIFRARRPARDPARFDPAAYAEENAMAMLYRKRREFAVGHGVSVHAEVSAQDPERARSVATRAVPCHELPRQGPPTSKDFPALAGLVLDMKDLGETPAERIGSKLEALPRAYAAWIDAERKRMSEPRERLREHEPAAGAALERCARALERIREGLALLAERPEAAEAFRFANRAMALQRVRSLYAEARRRGRDVEIERLDTPENRSWYPFQLAFIVLNLPALTDLHHPDRSHETDAVADLLWYPTGGGKTEAYLGLTAYTLALRRFQGTIEGRPGEQGIAVLMRYTLRLLTLQQFQRAATLLCACESLRREAAAAGDRRLGSTPFRIGLWVGRRTTPNSTEQSAEAVRRDHGGGPGKSFPGGGGTPAQLLACPWCGTGIDPGRHIKVETVAGGRGRTLTYCGDRFGTCAFSERQAAGEGLPIVVVDEEIYRLLPALLLATVDKFAQMPWNGATQMLFGQVAGQCPRHGFRTPEIKDSDSHQKRGALPAVRSTPHPPLRPPDLIIQDELHLISGPLGTLVGLYETAVDELSSWSVGGRRVRPKVIASTATVRRAESQVHDLFLRRLEVFPPHGLDASDSFFAVEREPSASEPGRLYIGVCAPGRRIKATLIRVYVAFLAAAQQLYDRHGRAADPWMTLVGYFNSIRELGGMRRLVEDDVRSRLHDTDARGLARRNAPKLEELTSRKSSTDIPRVLDRLETPFDPEEQRRRAARRKAGESVATPDPLDVLLATNMISVGVDVKRLGLMVVAGQPKATAEYIQATSRVGRSAPGLVCTVFNWARPRDLSHYERFEHYHAAFYQHVEALSVTPFAPRALDRGLTALLVSLLRLEGQDLNANDRAEALLEHPERVRAAVEAIVARAERVSGSTRTADDVRTMLRRRIDLWMAEARRGGGGRRLGYKDEKDGVTKGLLQMPGLGDWNVFTCLNSLRDVEPTVRLILDDHGLDDDRPEAPGHGGHAAAGTTP